MDDSRERTEAFEIENTETSDEWLCLCQLNVGCSSESSDLHSVRLEYSTDYGKSWRLVVPRCSSATLPPCDDQEIPSTVYYPGTTPYWQRIIIPLNGLPVCGYRIIAPPYPQVTQIIRIQ